MPLSYYELYNYVFKCYDNYKSYELGFFNNFSRHNTQLKIMFVGGPNERKDYHIEEGEEVRRNQE